MKIETPIIRQYCTVEEALVLLKAIGDIEKHNDEKELFYKASCNNFEVGLSYRW